MKPYRDRAEIGDDLIRIASIHITGQRWYTAAGLKAGQSGRSAHCRGRGPPPFVTGLGSPWRGDLAKGTPCRSSLASRMTPTSQSVIRSSLTTGSIERHAAGRWVDGELPSSLNVKAIRAPLPCCRLGTERRSHVARFQLERDGAIKVSEYGTAEEDQGDNDPPLEPAREDDSERGDHRDSEQNHHYAYGVCHPLPPKLSRSSLVVGTVTVKPAPTVLA